MRIPRFAHIRPLIEADPTQKIYTSKRYYAFLQRLPYLQRLSMVEELLAGVPAGRLLDIGFGSGFFLPALASHCKELYGLDIHPYAALVNEMLGKEQVQAELIRGDVLRLPYQDKTFDCITCVSTLEFVADVRQALAEIRRVARPGACVIIGAPVLNRLTEFCYDWIARSPYHRSLHKATHRQIIAAAEEKLQRIEKLVAYPRCVPVDWGLFFVLRGRV